MQIFFICTIYDNGHGISDHHHSDQQYNDHHDNDHHYNNDIILTNPHL